MPRIDHHAMLNILVAVRGHPFDRTAFDRLFSTMAGVTATMVDQPAAAQLMSPEGMAPYDALVLYDMPGIDLTVPPPAGPLPLMPPFALQAGLERLLRAGKGVVALHHALAGWPAWDDYAGWLGGRFLYRPAPLRGVPRLDSGYRQAVAQTLTVVPGHPVTAGLPPSFALVDEPYLAEIFEDEVIPLLHSDYCFTAEHFASSAAAMAGRPGDDAGWAHPAGSNVVGWAKRALASPLVYLQPGDGPEAYDSAPYRQLVENAIRWVASPEARAWARSG